MKRHSLSRRLISSVLLVELVFAVAVIALAAVYERHSQLRSFDIMLQGRADSLLGAVQDAEDQGDNVMLDRTGLQLPSEDVYEVRDNGGRLLGRSANWQGPDAHDVAPGKDTRIYQTKINGRHYRLLALHGLRVVDPGDKGGGTPRHILVVYGARTSHVWHQVRNAIVFFSLSNLVLLIVTGVLMAWLLHRGLAPMRQLAAEAENISIHRWSFQPPESAVETRELAPLASALTAAMQRLEASFSQQRRFVSDAAHELKTAVAVVKSSLQLLAMRQRTTEEYEAGIEVSLGDCERIEEIVARMLTLARAEHSTTAEEASNTSDLTVAVVASAVQFQSMAEVRSVAIALATSGPAFVPLSSEECALLCSNLLLNALQHSPPQSEVKVVLQPKLGWVDLHIEDQGDGIDPTLLPHVFERFSRGDPSRSRNTGGIGLGLAICKALVDKAGGTIALESERGHGTLASVRLPCTSGPAASLSAPVLQATPSA